METYDSFDSGEMSFNTEVILMSIEDIDDHVNEVPINKYRRFKVVI